MQMKTKCTFLINLTSQPAPPGTQPPLTTYLRASEPAILLLLANVPARPPSKPLPLVLTLSLALCWILGAQPGCTPSVTSGGSSSYKGRPMKRQS